MTIQESLTRPQPARLTIDDFLLLDRSGAFGDYKKSELVDGTVFVVNSAYSEHFTVQTLLLRRLADACDAQGSGIEAWAEGSIAIPPFDVPQPDIFVTSVRPGDGLVPLDTVLLVVEVAVTTLDVDMGRKLRLYASASIPEYWVADVNAKVIHQMWSPEGEAYTDRRTVAFGQPIAAQTVPDLAVETARL